VDRVDADLFAALGSWCDVRIALPHFADPIGLGDTDSMRAAALLAQRGAIVSTVGDVPPFKSRANLRVLRAPDPSEEVRQVVRSIATDLEAGIALPKQAILYRQSDPYAVLVRETLDAANFPWIALDGQPLPQTPPGRTLLAALRVGQTDFARASVLAWLTNLPPALFERFGSSSEWDRLTREANVVRGAAQWQSRLGTYAAEAEREAVDREQDGSAAWAEALRARARRARQIANTVVSLARALEPPAASDWHAFVSWAEEIRVRFASVNGVWPSEHARASDLVHDALAQLADADEFRGLSTLRVADFLVTLEAALASRSVPQGQLGKGVVIGPVQSATGLAFERVHMVGLVEGLFPPGPAADPFFPDESSDPLHRAALARAADRRAFLEALCAADDGDVQLGIPDSVGGRAAFPSRWALELIEGQIGGDALDASRLHKLSEMTHPWLRIVQSPLDGVTRAGAAVSLDERRVSEAEAWRRAGRDLALHALAQRGDLSIGRGVRLLHHKRSGAFTEFDGFLGNIAHSPRLRAFLDGSRPLSPTSLEVWATCPYHFYLESVLRVGPTEDPEELWTIDAAEKGSVVHDILEQFLSALAQEGRPQGAEAYSADDLALLERAAHERLQQTEAAGDAGHPLIWEATRQEILADLRTFLDRDTQWRRESGLSPAYFETSFGDGRDWPSVIVEVDDGSVRLRGRMDRVDVSDDGRRAFVFDYKTGSSSRYGSLDDPIDAGKHIQLAIYTRAVRQALGADVSANAAYWFVSGRGEFKQVELKYPASVVDGRLDDGLRLIARGIASGIFPPVPGSDDYLEDHNSNCRWCPYDSVCPGSRDQDWQRKQDDRCTPFVSLAEFAKP
jgi:RecB family exonuclease